MTTRASALPVVTLGDNRISRFNNMTDAEQTHAERVVTEVCDKLEARGAETKPVDYSDGYYKRPPDKKAR